MRMSAPATGDTRGLWLALGGHVIVFGMKLAVFFVTGLLAMLAEALHTLSDVLITGFLLIAIAYARRASDEEHMFGHGRAQNVAALVAATLLISFTSYKLYEESIPRLFEPPAAYSNLGLAAGVILISAVVVTLPVITLLRQRSRGAAASAQLLASLGDLVGLGAALAGILLVANGWPLGDPVASIVVATVIALGAVGLFRDNVSYLLGRSPGREYLAELERTARAVPGVVGVHDVRAEYIGPDTIHAGLHLEVPPQTPVGDADRVAAELRRRLHERGDPGYCAIQIEAGPARPA